MIVDFRTYHLQPGSLDEHREQEEAFYGSAAWREGPREAVVSRIESYHSIVLDLPEEAARVFRRDWPVTP
ncbi:hypothetical protein ACIBG7_23005 [Nonomuraea sp. NPDC050328]|uniref:hypothetical protein n=1 Tax=Nonomuraea sp. NPDC050328 TaxID=3364361 RepID=UPI0037B680F6